MNSEAAEVAISRTLLLVGAVFVFGLVMLVIGFYLKDQADSLAAEVPEPPLLIQNR